MRKKHLSYQQLVSQLNDVRKATTDEINWFLQNTIAGIPREALTMRNNYPSGFYEHILGIQRNGRFFIEAVPDYHNITIHKAFAYGLITTDDIITILQDVRKWVPQHIVTKRDTGHGVPRKKIKLRPEYQGTMYGALQEGSEK